MKFKLDTQTHPPTLSLIGDIDESSDFTKAEVPKSGAIAIDLSEIKHVNSMGLRAWVEWITKLKHLSPIFYRRCSSSVINQINILDGFLPRGSIVESFFVPYHCEPCDNTFNYLAQRGRDFREVTLEQPELNAIPTSMTCPNCGKMAEADIIEGRYLKFLKRSR